MEARAGPPRSPLGVTRRLTRGGFSHPHCSTSDKIPPTPNAQKHTICIAETRYAGQTASCLSALLTRCNAAGWAEPALRAHPARCCGAGTAACAEPALPRAGCVVLSPCAPMAEPTLLEPVAPASLSPRLPAGWARPTLHRAGCAVLLRARACGRDSAWGRLRQPPAAPASGARLRQRLYLEAVAPASRRACQRGGQGRLCLELDAPSSRGACLRQSRLCLEAVAPASRSRHACQRDGQGRLCLEPDTPSYCRARACGRDYAWRRLRRPLAAPASGMGRADSA